MNKYFMMLVIIPAMLVAQSDLKGEATITLDQAWDSGGNPVTETGLRYIPTWSVDFLQSGQFSLDAEIAGNLSVQKEASESGLSLPGNWARFHRGWVRLTTDRFEARLGLQKITFGSARLFRPLAWFDTIDPRDPQKYTTGVTGLRLRYDFPNNAGIWLWGVKNENSLLVIREKRLSPDIGGRLVYPFGPGEISIAYNYSNVKIEGDLVETGEFGYDIKNQNNEFVMNLGGIDGMWDVGVGLWFELAVSYIDIIGFPDWHSNFTLGIDYTFAVGNGLTITSEYYIDDYSEEQLFANDAFRSDLFGLMGSYPVSIMDNLSLFSVYYPDGEILYNYLNWQRTYDNWLVQVSAFFQTGEEVASLGSAMSTVGTKGLQINLIFNH